MRDLVWLARLIVLSLALAVVAPAATAAAASAAAPQQQGVVSAIEIHGNRRIPAETIRSRMFLRAGDAIDAAAIERDFMSLWNTGYFDDLRFEREDTTKGVVLHVYVKEKPTIREIKYAGLNAITQSDVLDRFKERKVGLTQESQYDPTKVKKAEVVLKELLAEHGHQFATIRTEIRPIPPAAVAVTFVVKEGPKVKVGRIKFEGNKKLSSRYLRSTMHNTKPIGIPHSIFLENIFARTYDASKLSEDQERIRILGYQSKGYFKAIVEDPQTKIHDTHLGWKGLLWGPLLAIPATHKTGKAVDITIPVVEGDRYTLDKITFSGNKAVNNTEALRKMIPLKDGEIFNSEAIRKGIENLRKAYGQLGYINMTSVPDTHIDDDKKLISLTWDIDEGKQFFVRRIEFTGNTTTRDKVIRREFAIEEGQAYNSQLLDFSILRLNQLNYFNPLKTEQDAEIKTNPNATPPSVDINLKVSEKGKNSIGLTGGVSGLSGSFIGINYSTNNFLGLGETLSVQADVGNLQRDLVFGFTEPYMFDRPLQVGFTVFTRKFNYNEAKQYNLLVGQKLTLPTATLNLLQNYTQSDTGFTVTSSYPLRRSLKRVGLTYSYDVSSIQTFSDASTQLFQQLAFRNFAGPNALKGIVTSKVIPVFTLNSVDRAFNPHTGKSFFVSSDVSGLGGTVRSIRPVIDYKQFVPLKLFRPNRDGHNVLGYHIQAAFITGYGGRVAPPFERFYLGGENDIRGFDIRTLSPIAYLVDTVNFPLINPDDPCVNTGGACTGVPKDPSNPRRGNISVPIPIQRLVYPGGDTSIVGNLEYRIPIAENHVVVAIFADTGIDAILRQNQLRVNPENLTSLNGTLFGCNGLDPSFNCTGGVPLNFAGELKPVAGTNWQPRLSTGAELQVMMPIINAPFRVYWAYNALRMDRFAANPSQITRGMFPAGGAGDFSYQQALATYGSDYKLLEPRKTFRFTVSTTF